MPDFELLRFMMNSSLSEEEWMSHEAGQNSLNQWRVELAIMLSFVIVCGLGARFLIGWLVSLTA
jgi:hypothetical protein